MIATELFKGQGFGNQLFCYITVRSLAKRIGIPFTIFGSENMANNIHSSCGMYFMNLDYGEQNVDKKLFRKYYEKEERLYIGNSSHDYKNGCYISGLDRNLFGIPDWTMILGNLQDENYFIEYIEDIRKWLKIEEKYETRQYSKSDICVMHIRCGDYLGNDELLLKKKYWINGMKQMRKINDNMRFVAVTDEITAAKRLLPQGVEVISNDLATDYSIIKNAYYLLLGNSSFPVLPAILGENVRFVIAPKYWARHNVSNGYWSSEQNIYSKFTYMDRLGELFSPKECRDELYEYKKSSGFIRRKKLPPMKIERIRLEMNKIIRILGH